MAMQILGGGIQFSGGASFQSWNPAVNYGSLYTWGLNRYGGLGNGSTIVPTSGQSSPGTVSGGGTTWSSIAAGIQHAAAIKTDGTLWTCGYNNAGQLGNGTTTNTSSPGTVSGGGVDWLQVTCGDYHTAAIKTNGTLWTWGRDQYGQLGNGITLANIAGSNGVSSPAQVAGGGTTWSQVSSHNSHTAAVKTDGTLWTWGRDNYGQLGVGTSTNRSSPGTVAGGGTTWKTVACGAYHTAAIKTDGTLWTCGYNAFGILGNGSTANTSSFATVTGGGTTWAQVAGGYYQTAAVKTDGTLWTWGYGYAGSLGSGTTTDRSSPGTVSGGGTTWSTVSVGNIQSAAVKTDGTLWTWGRDQYGQLGNGTTLVASTGVSSPTTVVGSVATWRQVSVGRDCITLAIAQ